ncbi:MAG: TrkA family potassium uptake protein, partial [Planctomycetaceae bacterium]|nr:TrkA family potassium uptake protein [Planctomycetaceae bacterium]
MGEDFYQRIAVIGLGRFGMALARRLSIHGAEVIAIDSDEKLVDEIRDDVAMAVRLNSTEEAALRSQEVDRVDCVVIAIGENFEAALLTTVICKKNLKIPYVICRAQTQFHAEIFRQIGADEVIQPEQNAGDMLGR